ncbi:MAG: Rrf2 family transcriptional regulator [Draconibacterium sp.]|nr:MAG: Rrf2 family transcriptional regulator [Draconibacterium sp.]
MLSNTCKYALRALIYLGKNATPEKKIGIKQLSKDLDISAPFLSKILQTLVKKDLLISAKGPNGGFALAYLPKDISLWDIVVNIDGESFFDNCLITTENCDCKLEEDKCCTVHSEYDTVRKNIIDFYKKTNLANVSKNH